MYSLYQQKIMNHYHFPLHKGTLSADCCVKVDQANPSCGDQITLYVCILEGIIQQAAFTGQGCILSLAAADMLIAFITAKTYKDVVCLNNDAMQQLVGIPVGPLRSKCLMLSLQALQKIYA